MKLKLLENISLLKSVGISRFITVEINTHYCKLAFIKRKELIYKINSSVKSNGLEIVKSFMVEYDTGFKKVKDEINSFIERENWRNPIIILGTNEFKFATVAIPLEEEEIDVWFLENSTKFLPNALKANEFSYAYEQFAEDENNRYFIVAIVRGNHLKHIVDSFSALNIKIISCFPFMLSLPFSLEIEESNQLLISIEDDSLSYFLKTDSQRCFYDRLFFQTSENYDRVSTIKEQLKNLRTHFSDDLHVNPRIPLNVFVGVKDKYLGTTKAMLISTFNPKTINQDISDKDTEYLTCIFAVKKLLMNYDKSLNLLNDNESELNRLEFEKNSVLHFILAGGFVILLFVIVSFFADRYLSNKLQNQNENLAGLQSITKTVEGIKTENMRLDRNLALLQQLKENRDGQAQLLEEIPDLVNDKICLSSLITNEQTKGIKIQMTGLSYSQKDIADLISQMEKSKMFNNVNLLYSSAKKNEKDQGQMFEFKISGSYNDF